MSKQNREEMRKDYEKTKLLHEKYRGLFAKHVSDYYVKGKTTVALYHDGFLFLLSGITKNMLEIALSKNSEDIPKCISEIGELTRRMLLLNAHMGENLEKNNKKFWRKKIWNQKQKEKFLKSWEKYLDIKHMS